MGLRLEAALKKLERADFHVVFSTALVQHNQRVMLEPRSAASAAMVRELLAPFGLSLSEISPAVFAVIRSAKSSAESLPATTASLPITLSELTVTASHYRLVGLSGTPLAIEGPQLRAEPHFADDALQSVGRLPGVAQNGFAGLMHIRGGESGETRVLLDGFPIREVFHLPDFQGPFSALDASAIKRIDVYTGGFPARYGDRLSGVLDIATRDVTESPRRSAEQSAKNIRGCRRRLAQS